MLISDNLLVRKNYFNSNIVWNKNVRILGCFSTDYFEAYIDRSQMFTSDVIKALTVTSSVSNVIYHKFSHGAAFYTLNGKNVNVTLEYIIILLIWSSGATSKEYKNRYLKCFFYALLTKHSACHCISIKFFSRYNLKLYCTQKGQNSIEFWPF